MPLGNRGGDTRQGLRPAWTLLLAGKLKFLLLGLTKLSTFASMKERVTDPIADARIGLAGPVWGLGAAVASWLVSLLTGAPIWRAIAELAGFLNLFNLMPIWRLDGSRGFHALSRQQR